MDIWSGGTYKLSLLMLVFCFLLVPSVQSATLTVCGSGCNSTTIQGAIDLAGSGDTVSVEAGSYVEALIINTSMILHGAGSESVTVTGQQKIRVSDVIFEGFTVVGTVIVDDFVNSISGGMIFNNTITGNSYGIRVGFTAGHGVNNISIIGNQIVANTNKGILFYDAGDYLAQHVSNISVIGNVIANNSGSGISTYGTGHNIIVNNTVTGNNGNGISIKYDDGDIVADNVIINNSAMGINVHQVTDSVIENNTVSNHVSTAVVTTFWGTVIVAGKGSAIYIHEVSEGNIIQFNDFVDNKIGVLVSNEGNNTGPSDNHINFNVVVNNTEYVFINALVNVSSSVDATDNWWGSATPNSSKFSGNVTYVPFCLDEECSYSIDISEFSGGDTTDFSAISNWSEVVLVLDSVNGMINWTVPIDLSGSSLGFGDSVTISHRRISVDAGAMPELDQPAILTFALTGFTGETQFIVMRNGAVCPVDICLSYHLGIDGSVELVVTQLSEYDLMESPIYQVLSDSGSGLGGFFTAITNPLSNIILGLGVVGGILAMFMGVAMAIRRAVGGAASNIGR